MPVSLSVVIMILDPMNKHTKLGDLEGVINSQGSGVTSTFPICSLMKIYGFTFKDQWMLLQSYPYQLNISESWMTTKVLAFSLMRFNLTQKTRISWTPSVLQNCLHTFLTHWVNQYSCNFSGNRKSPSKMSEHRYVCPRSSAGRVDAFRNLGFRPCAGSNPADVEVCIDVSFVHL